MSEKETQQAIKYINKKLNYFEKNENFLMDNREEYLILVNIFQLLKKQ
jgi:hypothetical protein